MRCHRMSCPNERMRSLISCIILQLVATAHAANAGSATNQHMSNGVVSGTSSSGIANGNNGLQCQRITVPACQGLGYNMTAMPNLAGHTNQLEAELRVGTKNKKFKENKEKCTKVTNRESCVN